MEIREPNNIEIFNILIQEPMRSSTDVLVGIVSLILCYKLYKTKIASTSYKAFIFYFFFMGLTTLSAGTIGHAFQYIFSYNWKTLGWSFSALSIFVLQQASYRSLIDLIGKKVFKILNVASFLQIFFFFGLIINPETRLFTVVQVNSAIGLMGMILPVHLYAVYQGNIKSSRWISLALLWGLVPAVVYNFELGIHQWFDHSAVSHILMIIFLIIMYQGVKRIVPQHQF
ncbi:MAG: hypothetical protein OEW75_13435 [Cyclobacteriaceae bacterium]|nr:hypothetical protein [Cyclobacteriaceae bacterium]